MALIEGVSAALDRVVYGPWLGSMRSKTGDQVPPEFIASINSTTPSNNFLYLPRTGTWKLRGGSSVKFDTFGSLVGMLPAKWAADPLFSSGGARIRHFEEFVSDSITDGIPTVCALLTRETVPSTALDDGRFSQFWIRDQTNTLSYTLGDEFTQTYAAIGTTQTYRIPALWYDSGDGGLTRGASAFLRRFLVCGSRDFLKVGNWWYFPSILGTPTRWRGRFRPSALAGASSTQTATSDVTVSQVVDEANNAYGGGNTAFSDVATAGDSHWIRLQNDPVASGGRTTYLGLSGTINDNTTYIITYSAKNELGTPNANTSITFALVTSAKKRYAASAVFPAASWTTSFPTTYYTATVVCDGSAGVNGALTANTIEFGQSGTVDTGTYSAFDYMIVGVGDSNSEANANYLLPTGPFPPVHCGTVTASSPVTPIYARANADNTDGSWLNTAGNNTNMFSYVDEATADDSDYIHSNGSNTACIIDLDTPSSVPTTSDTVTLRFRNRNIVSSGHNNVTTDFMMNGTVIATVAATFYSTTSWALGSLELTETQIAAATTADATWATASARFTTSSESGSDRHQISQLYLEILPAAANSEGGWKGKDRFMRALYGRFEDGSIWALTQPRFPNTTLTNGLDLVTVDSGAPDLTYTSITHTNLPILGPGFTHVGICRTDKIDSTVDDNLQIDPTAMKLIAEVPNGTTSYIDYSGDDASLTLDVEQAFIRYDHIMAQRTRYIAGGDMRVIAGYGGESPVAIVIAPVGRTSDYDLNLAADSSTLYTSNASYMQFALASNGTGTLTLIQSDGATATDTKTITLGAAGSGTNDTLQKLVDTINATSCAVDGQQWRAQLICGDATGSQPDACPLTSLVPHNRAIASCVIDNTAKTITKAAGGLSKVAVGQLISGAAEEAGAYVTVITSDTSLTYTGTLTTGTETLYFYNNLGDSHITDPDTSTLGFQRVISNSVPGFLYFNKTYLDTQTFDKSATWMTVASPGSVKAAPNCWSGKLSNRFTPPLEAGICQGGVAVDHGFVVAYGNKIGAIRPRGPDSFLDQEYGLTIIDESRGCCAWNTLTPGNRFAAFMSTEGVFAADLERVKLLSEAIYVDMPVATGDFTYENPKSVAASAMDVDIYASDSTVGAYAWARIARGMLYIGYRSGNSGGTTHCDRMVRLDFTSGDESTGIPALFRRPGEPWGWSTPLLGSSSGASAIYRYALICEARRSDGLHIYGWNEENGGSTGDGRVDEIETGTTDPNSTAITGRVEGPWLRPGDSDLISVQEAVLEHSSPSGSTGSLVFHRTFSDDSYTLTPGTSALGVYAELKFLPQGARANANAAYWDYRQATGSARELRRVVLKFRRVRRFK